MALDPITLGLLMAGTMGLPTPQAKLEFDAIAEGVVNGLKAGTALATCVGSTGVPAPSIGTGALHGGAATMLPLLIANCAGLIPPVATGGTPQPAQALWFNAVSQIGNYTMASLQVQLPPGPTAIGVGTVPPGGYTISGPLIGQLIVAAYVKSGLTVTPMKIQIANAIGNTVQQHMLLATTIIPLVGGPVPTPSPASDPRSGIIL